MSAMKKSPVPEDVGHKSKGFIEKSFPKVWPFVKLMRVHRHVEVLVAFWPFTWGFLLAANTSAITITQIPFFFALFFLSTVIWVGASHTINDMWDKSIDTKVERCKTRPVASGEVSMMQAAIFYSVLIVVCVLLTLPMNKFCQKVILFNIIPITLYPASKRVIACPSVAFGIVANWGALIGWSAVMQNLDISVCGPLYFGAICWTVVYDTIYGSQDKKDDVHVGIHSMALTLGSNCRTFITLAGIGAISGLILAGAASGMGWPYYLGMLVASMHLGNQIFSVDLENPLDCNKKYSDNVMFGFLVFLAMLAGSWGSFPMQRDLSLA